ncbi:putative alpha-1,2-mannosidase [Dysgonomonas hofstadii]|uniref:Putative alpha-1,2-mannosidase n=1 Tax=Dysgonomonas hofstadii TaxID=637886 RepID=A0A840CHR2_9BACT|nr:GH92 family glycosyl hydrolase [Dysgonomonas hofstadii]MBB4035500.1 putative alpha-1,2-mannosidase [Dysgonomonas hofstadii]
MKILILLFCGVLSLGVLNAQQQPPVDYVNPLVGTQSKRELSTGNTYPAIARPWGMNFWTPQTGKMGNGWTYTYDADKIRGFKQTHQPSPWMNDYGQFSIMPITGKTVIGEDERASWFSHKSEIAKPYYYSVYLADHDITTEITPTSRAAMFRFTFSESDSSYVVVDAFDKGSYVKIIPEENKIIGYTTKNSGGVPQNFKNYFVIKFDKPFTFAASFAGNDIKEGQLEMKDNHAGAVIGFPTKRREQVQACVASSFISFEQAELNLRELADNSFEEIKQQGRDEWNDILGRIVVEDDNIDNLRTFYSCLYRSVLFPRSFYEYNARGEVVHYSPFNGKVLPGYMFADTGFWDTFRSLFPFLNLVYPSMNEKMQEWLVNSYEESGFLPEWSSPGHRDCMIGNNSASVVADAYIKGLRGYDTESLWNAMMNATTQHLKGSASGRVGHEYYNRIGYIPSNVNIRQNVARTLEYAYNDWTIYQFGKAIGKPEAELDVFKQRAMNYKNVFDPEHKLMVGRDDKGRFNPNFEPEDWSRDFTEGNSWHWSFCVFHDPQGLIDLMGGKHEFNTMMDSVFIIPSYKGMTSRSIIHEMREMQVMDMGQYAHGNQPIQHMVYLYNYSGQAWKAQYWVREIMDKLYNPNADGYCGDEDNGQTSAWYVFSAMGFYPVCPGTDEYVLGSPLFRKVIVKLENGNQIEITADNKNSTRYVDSVTVAGKLYEKNYLTHGMLMSGAKINYKMSPEPNTIRGTKPESFPYSFSNENK